MDKIPALDPKPGTSQQSDLQIQLSSKPSDKTMETELVGPSLPPQFVQRFDFEFPSDGNSEQSKAFHEPKNQSHKRKHKSWAKYITSPSSFEESEVSVQVKKSSKHKGDSSE